MICAGQEGDKYINCIKLNRGSRLEIGLAGMVHLGGWGQRGEKNVPRNTFAQVSAVIVIWD